MVLISRKRSRRNNKTLKILSLLVEKPMLTRQLRRETYYNNHYRELINKLIEDGDIIIKDDTYVITTKGFDTYITLQKIYK